MGRGTLMAVVFLSFVYLSGAVLADDIPVLDSWGDEGESDEVLVEEDVVADSAADTEVLEDTSSSSGSTTKVSSSSGSADKEFTLEFYISVGLGILVVLILLVFAYFLFRRPSNKF